MLWKLKQCVFVDIVVGIGKGLGSTKGAHPWSVYIGCGLAEGAWPQLVYVGYGLPRGSLFMVGVQGYGLADSKLPVCLYSSLRKRMDFPTVRLGSFWGSPEIRLTLIRPLGFCWSFQSVSLRNKEGTKKPKAATTKPFVSWCLLDLSHCIGNPAVRSELHFVTSSGFLQGLLHVDSAVPSGRLTALSLH